MLINERGDNMIIIMKEVILKFNTCTTVASCYKPTKQNLLLLLY